MIRVRLSSSLRLVLAKFCQLECQTRASVLYAFGAAAPLAAAGELGVDITIKGEITPGVYGRVDLTNRAPPPLVYAQPVVIERPPPHVVVEPVYLHVPPGHAKNWRKH